MNPIARIVIGTSAAIYGACVVVALFAKPEIVEPVLHWFGIV